MSAWNPALDDAPRLRISAVASRQNYGRGTDLFSIVLVGKDGGIKDRGTVPGDIQEMLTLIDTMPMRQRELNARKREAERREKINNRMWGDETFGR